MSRKWKAAAAYSAECKHFTEIQKLGFLLSKRKGWVEGKSRGTRWEREWERERDVYIYIIVIETTRRRRSSYKYYSNGSHFINSTHYRQRRATMARENASD